MHIFISYAKRDTFDLAIHLRDRLRQIEGVTIWMDETLEPGESWALQIQQEIDAANYVVVLLSPDVNRPIQDKQRRSFVLNEIDYAQQENKPIIPVMAQKTRVPVQIAGVQFIDFTADFNKGMERLIRKLAPQIVQPTAADAAPEPSPLNVPTARELKREAKPRLAGNLSRRTRNIALMIIGLLLASIVILVIANPFNNQSFSSPENQTAMADLQTSMSGLVTVGAALQTATSAAATQIEEADMATNSAATQTHEAEVVTGQARLAETNLEATETKQAEVATNEAYFAATQTALAAPSSNAYVTANHDWQPAYQTFDDVQMALVPAGCFMMGSDTGSNNQKPAHEQCFDEPFWIDRYEVTNDLYGSEAFTQGDRRPRDSVTWFEARDFCVSRGARLPTEREWEYAARGPDNLLYPWGNELMNEPAVHASNSNGESADVGSMPDGNSWVGASDMSGNLWEWVSTIYDEYPYNADKGIEDMDHDEKARVLRGGSWGLGNTAFAAPYREGVDPHEVNNEYGFRCARDIDG